MKKEIIEYLHNYGLIFASDFKIHDLTGGYIGINYNKDEMRFGIFAKRNLYYYEKKDIDNIKNEIDEKFKIICKLNDLLKKDK